MFMIISMTQQVSKAKWWVANPWHIIIFADSIPMIGWLAYLRVVTLMFPPRPVGWWVVDAHFFSGDKPVD